MSLVSIFRYRPSGVIILKQLFLLLIQLFMYGPNILSWIITLHEKVIADALNVLFICSQDQIADTLTKPLSTACFQTLRSMLTHSAHGGLITLTYKEIFMD
jgi:hypothetical protein